jgi:CDP-4-dehydro-6-deoxyglucose reductase
MTYQVTLSPSGRTITVEPNETILEAALREGHAVDYHCANGSCGDCRARILEGALANHLHHDYSFKGPERQQPMLLMCRAIPASDMMIEVREAVSVDDIPLQQIPATATSRKQLTEDFVELQVRTPRSQTLRFLAGQHVKLHFGDHLQRNKSVASCPCNGRDLRFHFRRTPGEPVSEYIFHELRPRDPVVIEGPYGNFILDETGDRKIVLFAYETGFAPIKSLIEHAISMDLQVPIELVWFARDDAGHYLKNQCRAWRDALDNFDFSLIRIPALTEANRIDNAVQSVVEKALGSQKDTSGIDVYVSAPEPLYLGFKEVVETQSLSGIRIYRDDLKRY